MNTHSVRRLSTATAVLAAGALLWSMARTRAGSPALAVTALADSPRVAATTVVERRADPSLATAAPIVGAPASPPNGSFDEDELMRLLRSARGNDPKLSAELAREGNRRFPVSAAAPERASILIHALAEQGLASEARGEAEDMVNRYPDSGWVREIERFTGAHRHRNFRVGAEGRLEAVDPTPPG
jgi:hypothetical protein